ncbi:MBOAT family protein [Flavobacterium sp. LM4]|uniref:MBOAT family O-acyltransferase n=1 Tax=Flavobacterium sp. LM4 TaxID=1938609 RepID=UPI000992B4D4|nr:MBOAT family O-acyltransferase [Flavobacterium sp. LM4]OOV18390.1 membrane-bound O-acyltransferase family protein [Flavobacterium sp. LM4]
MFFNSLAFAIFLPIVFLLYWFVFNKTKNTQNALLIVASYYFYSCWDWRFLFLLVFSTFLDYYTGIQIEKGKSEVSRKFWFWLSIIVNLGFLGIFKYYNFFAVSFSALLNSVGVKASPILLDVILPVGISFYTFHGLSYVIDIYYKRIKPEYNFVDYSLFVSYFPLLVAGPIERATHLLPQVKEKRVFNYAIAVDGLRQILWGLFKKVVIADNCADYANIAFDNSGSNPGSILVLGAIFFAFQIYGDFSGYSDIALGVSKLFGIDLLRNFNYPYFSRDIAEFWRRWHISLSSWFRDYIYIPLGGSKVSKLKQIRNVFIIFIVSGFWHGANWTFIVWGLLNALFILPSIIFKTNRNNLDLIAKDRVFPSFKESFQIIRTFAITCFAWIFFRAKDLDSAFSYIKGIFSSSLFTIPRFDSKQISIKILLVLILFFVIKEWTSRSYSHVLYFSDSKPIYYKWGLYFLLFMVIIIWGVTAKTEFIYFAF